MSPAVRVLLETLEQFPSPGWNEAYHPLRVAMMRGWVETTDDGYTVCYRITDAGRLALTTPKPNHGRKHARHAADLQTIRAEARGARD